MPVHEEVLAAANRIASQRTDWTFTPREIIQALPILNESSIRTDIVSRCCVNAPKNHLRTWDYFRRVGHGRYQVIPKYRNAAADVRTAQIDSTETRTAIGRRDAGTRDVIHVVVTADSEAYTAECLEVSAVTQGHTLDELIRNLREAITLHLEGENLAELGLSEHPRVQLIFDEPFTL